MQQFICAHNLSCMYHTALMALLVLVTALWVSQSGHHNRPVAQVVKSANLL
jgi:hypothetical protein